MVKNHSDSERGRKEGIVLFNDALNTFYLQLYGVRHMVKTGLTLLQKTKHNSHCNNISVHFINHLEIIIFY